MQRHPIDEPVRPEAEETAGHGVIQIQAGVQHQPSPVSFERCVDLVVDQGDQEQLFHGRERVVQHAVNLEDNLWFRQVKKVLDPGQAYDAGYCFGGDQEVFLLI